MTKYEILADRCVQTGNCLEIAPELFVEGEEEIETTKASADTADEQEAVQRAARNCPALAIALRD